jgi:hypothetical protein
MFSGEPMLPTLYAWLQGIGISFPAHFTVPWPMLITVPVGTALLIWVLFESVSTKAHLNVILEQRAPYVFARPGVSHYRIGIHNSGRVAAVGVTVRLLKIDPSPEAVTPPLDFPYRVTRAIANEALDLSPCDISPMDEELYEFAQSWVTGQPDNRLIVSRIDTKGPLDKSGRYLEIMRDEKWRCVYRASCANADPVDFSVAIEPRGDTLSAYLQ